MKIRPVRRYLPKRIVVPVKPYRTPVRRPCGPVDSTSNRSQLVSSGPIVPDPPKISFLLRDIGHGISIRRTGRRRPGAQAMKRATKDADIPEPGCFAKFVESAESILLRPLSKV
jgi:hypothetical protein